MTSNSPKGRLIFRDVYIGGLSKTELFKKLHENKIGLNEFALKFINHSQFKLSSSKEKLRTVEISVDDLGFPDGATTNEICQKAHEFDFAICPHDLGIYLRLQYLDCNQPIDPPKGNWQNIILDGTFDEPGFNVGFYIRHREDGFWLRGYRASYDHLWSPSDRFIFITK